MATRIKRTGVLNLENMSLASVKEDGSKSDVRRAIGEILADALAVVLPHYRSAVPARRILVDNKVDLEQCASVSRGAANNCYERAGVYVQMVVAKRVSLEKLRPCVSPTSAMSTRTAAYNMCAPYGSNCVAQPCTSHSLAQMFSLLVFDYMILNRNRFKESHTNNLFVWNDWEHTSKPLGPAPWAKALPAIWSETSSVVYIDNQFASHVSNEELCLYSSAAGSSAAGATERRAPTNSSFSLDRWLSSLSSNLNRKDSACQAVGSCSCPVAPALLAQLYSYPQGKRFVSALRDAMPPARADYLRVLWDELFAASNKSTRALANCKAAKSLDFDKFFEIRYDSLLEGLRSWNC